MLRAENKEEATENLLRALKPYEDSLTEKFFGGNVFNSVQCNNNTGNACQSITIMGKTCLQYQNPKLAIQVSVYAVDQRSNTNVLHCNTSRHV